MTYIHEIKSHVFSSYVFLTRRQGEEGFQKQSENLRSSFHARLRAHAFSIFLTCREKPEQNKKLYEESSYRNSFEILVPSSFSTTKHKTDGEFQNQALYTTPITEFLIEEHRFSRRKVKKSRHEPQCEIEIESDTNLFGCQRRSVSSIGERSKKTSRFVHFHTITMNTSSKL